MHLQPNICHFYIKKWQRLGTYVSVVWIVLKLSCNRSGNNECVKKNLALFYKGVSKLLSFRDKHMAVQPKSIKPYSIDQVISGALWNRKQKNDLHSNPVNVLLLLFLAFCFVSAFWAVSYSRWVPDNAVRQVFLKCFLHFWWSDRYQYRAQAHRRLVKSTTGAVFMANFIVVYVLRPSCAVFFSCSQSCVNGEAWWHI